MRAALLAGPVIAFVRVELAARASQSFSYSGGAALHLRRGSLVRLGTR